jgi:hypothetical protein
VCSAESLRSCAERRVRITAVMDVWNYIDAQGAVRGPVPASVLCKLIEKGLIVDGTTHVWKKEIDTWKPMSEVSHERTRCIRSNIRTYIHTSVHIHAYVHTHKLTNRQT